MHGGAAPQVRRKAEERLMLANDDAASMLVRLMSDTDVPYAERRRIAEFIMTYDKRNEVRLELTRFEASLDYVFVDFGDDNPDEPQREIKDSGRRPVTEADAATRLPAHDPNPPRYGTA
jgi:hypothetical protein